MKLRASGEDYLEAVLMLQKKNGMVRSIDLARHMEVSKPSVSRTVGKALVVLNMRGMLWQNQKGKVVLHRCVQSLRYKLVNEFVKLVNKKDLVSKTLHFVATFTRPMLVI